uniref:Exostosin-2 n=1 Tax=Dermatophagoides pteronyssinus TaxID=6956 RepID=A0A6P6XQG1_DERPT|nr:exostosin-2-like [Dermatophagoides pteronyssinus]
MFSRFQSNLVNKIDDKSDVQKLIPISDDQNGTDNSVSNRHDGQSSGHSYIVILFILLLITLFIVFIVDGYFELAILLKLTKILSSQTSLNYICKTYISYGFVHRDNEAISTNVTVDDIFRHESESPEIFLVKLPKFDKSVKKPEKCSHYSCFDLYRCGLINYNPFDLPKQLKNNVPQERIKIFVYPSYKFVMNDNQIINISHSLEYQRILRAIVTSPYYTNKPHEACLFIPNVDTLNSEEIDRSVLNKILWSLPYFQQTNGTNHLIFVMINQKYHLKRNWLPNFPQIMIASGMFTDRNYRLNFDIATPVYSLFAQLYESWPNLKPYEFDVSKLMQQKRKWTIVSTQMSVISEQNQKSLLRLESFYSNRMILFGFDCSLSVKVIKSNKLPFWQYRNESSKHIWRSYKKTIICNNDRHIYQRYLDVLHDSQYCLIMPSASVPTGPLLTDILMSGCIPVIVDDNYVLPFQERIDWTTISLRIRERSLNNLFEIIDSLSSTGRLQQLRLNALNVWNRFFRNVENIALTTLDIINERVYPKPRNIQSTFADKFQELTPLSYDYFAKGFNYISPKNLNLISDGFTAVILTYNRLDSLFHVVSSISRVPGCQKILIVWNNQNERPPLNDQWAPFSMPIQVIQTNQNKLSNRFFPYASIETEAIFAIDDDITMLNPDEIEFSYQTWREFPDRIVGFPSRLHLWNNLTESWTYDSEWKNKISLILTGAAFYHHYYNYLYTYVMPETIRKWVDDNMNCEDIAMNFLVSNVTGKAPIKVTPRKKFKCPECSKANSLSTDVVHHLQLRSRCIDHFSKIYRMMPLKAVEFRSDPVLFRDNIPEKFKHFSLIGNL